MQKNKSFENEYSQEVPIYRLRRITGYLVSDLTRFNSAKREEVADRTKHLGRIGFQEDYNVSSHGVV